MNIVRLLMWVERIEPSTTRNGLKGAVMNVAFLFAVVSIGPTFIPGLCQRDPAPVSKPWRKLTNVFFGKGAGPKVCACHIDFKRYAGMDIEHLTFHAEPTCESQPEPQNVWIVPEEPTWKRETYSGTATLFAVVVQDGFNGEEHTLKAGEGEYRWHCTEDSEYLK